MSSIATFRSALVELYSDRTQAEVARIIGTTQQNVSASMRRFGISARPKHTPAPKGRVAQALTRRGRTTGRSAREMFLNMYRTRGLSLRQIAFELGTSSESVRNFAISRRIPLRTWGNK